MSVSSSSWGLGRAAVCDCGTPWTFLLPFLKDGYHQIELSEDSRDITTFVTNKGLYRYKRLNFGISSASEMYQHIIEQVIQGCEGARNISDDIIVFGKTKQEHDARVCQVLERLRDRGLTLNPDKSKFCMDRLVFFGGNVLSRKGIAPEEVKVEAILHAKEPENVLEVRSFLGLVNFNARFIPDLAIIAEPLRRLTKKNVVCLGSRTKKVISNVEGQTYKRRNSWLF